MRLNKILGSSRYLPGIPETPYQNSYIFRYQLHMHDESHHRSSLRISSISHGCISSTYFLVSKAYVLLLVLKILKLMNNKYSINKAELKLSS
jgi:hypothetical protein